MSNPSTARPRPNQIGQCAFAAVRLVWLLLALPVGSAALPTASAAPAAPTFTVNNPSDVGADPLDTNYSVCRTNDTTGSGTCTLRAAIMKANHFAGGGVNIIVPSGLYTMTQLPSGGDGETNGDLNIDAAMTLVGAGAASTILDGLYHDRLFHIAAGVNTTISGLTIRHGEITTGDGGGIVSEGTLTLTNSVVEGNGAQLGFGGGVAATGNLTLDHTIISGNKSSLSGGGIYSTGGPLRIYDSLITNNTALNGSGGGLSVPNSTLVALDHDVLSGNHARFSGGALDVGSAAVTINNSTFNANTSVDGGAINNNGNLTINNSTLSANSATHNGGAILNTGTASLFHATLAGNLANSNASGDGDGGGIENSFSVHLHSTLLAENFQGFQRRDCGGVYATSADYNYIQVGNCLFAPGSHDLSGGDALLGPLQDNGGPTPTRDLLAASPALNRIPTNQCYDSSATAPVPDQRGVARPINGLCDMGAYEGVQPYFVFNRNLVRNGDAESGGASPTGAFVGIPNWSVVVGHFTAVPYDAPGGFPSVLSPMVPLNHGYNFFAGGDSSDGAVTQTITVTAASAMIDAGGVSFILSADQGGIDVQADSAAVSASFLDQTGNSTGSPVTLPAVGPSDRGNQTGFIHQSTTDLVPPGIRFIEIQIYATDISGYNDGYADNVSLVLHGVGTLYLPLVGR